MSNYWWWLILSQVTGSPVLALVLLFAGGWALDQFTLGILPSPLRTFRRWRRSDALADLLAINPHDRRARFELADLLVGQRRYERALEVLKPNVAAGDSDPGTLFIMGCAAYGAGFAKEAETFLSEALEQDPEYRLGAILLEQGRGRLAAGDPLGAQEVLTPFCAQRVGTVEGRVLLAQACDARGEKEEAARWRREAWKEYASAPAFLQRQERSWAWRIRPWRPILLALLVGALGFGVVQLLPHLRSALPGGRGGAAALLPMMGPAGVMAPPSLTPEQQARYREALAPPVQPGGGPIDPARFVRLPPDAIAGTAKLRNRWMPGDPDPRHAARALPGDMLCRLWARYGAPDGPEPDFSYAFRDARTGVVFSAYSAGSGPAYGAGIDLVNRQGPDRTAARASAELTIGAFDQLLDETQPVDCSRKFSGDEGAYVSGVRGGVPFADDL